jgi:hypothetical protein
MVAGAEHPPLDPPVQVFELLRSEAGEQPTGFFRLFFYGLSGDAPPELVRTLYLGKPRAARLPSTSRHGTRA